MTQAERDLASLERELERLYAEVARLEFLREEHLRKYKKGSAAEFQIHLDKHHGGNREDCPVFCELRNGLSAK